MLIGFFKNQGECSCAIVKYSDRIWLSKSGDGEILRTFVVKVDEKSPEPLREIRLLLPFKYIKDLKSVNETCFMSSSEHHFNSPQSSSTQNYKIIQKPTNPARYDSFGMIDHDGLKGIKVFDFSENCSSYQVGACAVIRLQFPCDLKKGELSEIRLIFRTTSLFTKITNDENPVYIIQFTYFSQDHIDEIDELGRKLEIKVKPTLGKDKLNRWIAGFDSIIYFPSEFEKASEFKADKETFSLYNIEGKKAPKSTLKLIYRLRSLLKTKGLAVDTLTGIGQELVASGTLKRRYDVTKPLMLSIEQIDKKIRKNTLFGYIAIILSIASIIYNLFIKYLQ